MGRWNWSAPVPWLPKVVWGFHRRFRFRASLWSTAKEASEAPSASPPASRPNCRRDWPACKARVRELRRLSSIAHSSEAGRSSVRFRAPRTIDRIAIEIPLTARPSLRTLGSYRWTAELGGIAWLRHELAAADSVDELAGRQAGKILRAIFLAGEVVTTAAVRPRAAARYGTFIRALFWNAHLLALHCCRAVAVAAKRAVARVEADPASRT